MPTCVAPGCTSGYKSNLEKVHFFTVPKDSDSAKLWKIALKRQDNFVKSGSAVCEKHFKKSEILWKRELLGTDGQVLGVSHYKIPRLKKGCVPSQFPWTECAESGMELENLSCQDNNNNESIVVPQEVPLKHQTAIEENNIPFVEPDLIISVEQESPETTNCSLFQFHDIFAANLNLPTGWSKQITSCGNKQLMFFFIFQTVQIEDNFQTSTLKDVTVEENLSIHIRILGQRLNPTCLHLPSFIENAEQLENLLTKIHRFDVCHGCLEPVIKTELEQLNLKTVRKDISGVWRHTECSLLISTKKRCENCNRAKKSLETNFHRFIKKKANEQRKMKKTLVIGRKQLTSLQSRYRAALKVKRLARGKIKQLEREVFDIHKKLTQCTSKDLEQHIANGKIPQNQMHVLTQIIEAAKRKNTKGRKYSEEWMLLCMLLHMRSPAGYEFLRCNEILPLPSVRTIRRYLSNIKTVCGFDMEFLQVMKLALEKQEESQRHGILLFDEISTRESVSVASKQLTYKGLIDFGSEQPKSSNFSEKANHALVLMYQPLESGHAQPVAVFASRGPVTGNVLAQLIIKAIILMEKIGVKIHGVVSDGASSNRKFWTEVGVNGSKEMVRNYFEHPVIPSEKIYVFSDTPHLIKTIRNRLYNNGVLQMDPSQSVINWQHIKLLYEKDREHAGPGQGLVCPKLTANHVNLNNSLKMRVRLATQVFSNTVAGALRFFAKYVPELRDCENTASFCLWINDMFDALNRKRPTDGVEPKNHDFKVIQDSLKKLDEWEEHVQKGRLPKDRFLTKQTAEGLRVTLHSTLDLVEYLTEHCRFPYVLTGRINQDPLENFFGVVRQAGGCDDHPSTPTFLNIFKILSIYSVLRPPNTGNCSILMNDKTEPLVTLGDLKTIYHNPDSSKDLSNSIKNKLQQIIQNEDWDFENVIADHDYNMPEITNCVLYCLTADLTKKICNTVKCLRCKEALLNSHNATVVLPEATLYNWQQRSGLMHPNKRLYRFVLYLEKSFQTHCHASHVFEELLHDVYDYNALSFPCKEHAHEILYQLIQNFVLKRMQQYCTRVNYEQKKDNQLSKKKSKFCKT